MAEAPKKKKWIRKAVAGGKGEFSGKAEKAGETTREFAREKEGAPGKLGKEARMAETLMGLHHGKAKAEKLYTPKHLRRAG